MTSSNQVQPQREFEFTDRHFSFLANLANSKTGIMLPANKRDMVYGRLVRRLRALHLQGFEDYCKLLESSVGDDELPHLINAITTNLTRFFREEHHFQHLKEEIIKLTNTGQKKLRIWSAACSSGMEPYSIAMTVNSALRDINKWDAKILATDIDSNMLATGAAGEYSLSDVDESVPAPYKTYVQQGSRQDKVVMGDELKRLIAFKQLNLLENWPMKGPFDMVFCRNVVIYFDKPTKQALFERMASIIKPGGWLYIGHSENLHGVSDRFELVGRTTYRRVK